MNDKQEPEISICWASDSVLSRRVWKESRKEGRRTHVQETGQCPNPEKKFSTLAAW